ncbi:MAG TPA: helix-turn-helix transcriptional regulator [Candidatus Angelobacter sp.]|jgi:transcriptional regulator with XRE-family HTH domain|nr:helix-turn-helix transcriptional regulator [Candidatus Angelobacter sp.]
MTKLNPTHQESTQFLKNLGKRLRYLRSRQAWSQQQLAYESGLATASMGAIERGEVNTTLDSLLKLSQALGLTLSQLLTGTEPGFYKQRSQQRQISRK